MHTTSDLVRHCKEQGFGLTKRNTLSRCVGNGILQQIYYGEKDRISVGITSMYGDLPDIFWQSKVPFTFYSVSNLHGMPSPRFECDFDKTKDIRLLLEGGLSKLNNIITQEKLVEFSLESHQIEPTTACHMDSWLWGAYLVCGMKNQMMYEVCYYYTDICEGFRRSKESTNLLEQNRFEEYILKWQQKEQTGLWKLSDLWHALLLNNEEQLNQYIQNNYTRNMWQVSKQRIPIFVPK